MRIGQAPSGDYAAVAGSAVSALADQDVAARVTAWSGGRRVLPRFPSPLSKAVAGAGPEPE